MELSGAVPIPEIGRLRRLVKENLHPGLPGVRKALERYEAERGARLPAVPVCDITGTLVIPF